MYRLVFDVKEQAARNAKAPILTELGRELCGMLKIQTDTILKKTEKDFEQKYPDKDIAALHFAHHQKRREKNLIKMQEQYRKMKIAEM